MKLKTNSLICAASVLACPGLAPLAGAADASPATDQSEAPLYHPFTFGLEAGTTGFGGSGSWRFADHWGVRAGGDYLSWTISGLKVEGISYDSKLRLLSEPLTFDIYPWKKSSFHISVGMMFNQNQLTGTADQTGTIVINGVPVPISVAGALEMKIHQQPVNPYLSIGGNFFYFDHAHHWAMGGELGVTYTGDPTASVTRTGPSSVLGDAVLAAAQRELVDYANKFKWWPVAKLAVSYSF